MVAGLALSVMVRLVVCDAAELGDELLVNGSFETAGGQNDRPAGWSWDSASQWVSEGGNRWVLQEATTPATRSIGQLIALEERYWKLRVSCRVRLTNVVQGVEGWHDARIAMQFQDAQGQMVGAWPNVLRFTGSTAGWERHERDFIVPPGAARLSLSCSLFSTTGRVEWDDVSVKLFKFDPVPEDAEVPESVVVRWDLDNAYREETATRGRVCINGLWRFHPVTLETSELPNPGTGWGYLKVPGTWAPSTSRQKPFGPDIWEEQLDLNKIDAAWYQRMVTVPAEWRGREVFLNIDNPKHSARVLVDGKEAGTIEWPGGRLKLTNLVQPGQTHELSIFTLALPLTPEQIVVMGPDQIEKARAQVRFKGLCGDCWLESEPMGARITDVFVKPSVRKHELALQCELADLDATRRYRLAAAVTDGEEIVREFASGLVSAAERIEFSGAWPDAKLWDIDQPNLYKVRVSLSDEDGKLLDQTTPIQFGFREFWIQGKDFYLNGSPIHLRCLDYFNAGEDFALASYDQARHTFAQARKLGFNYVIHSNYDYEPQSVAYIDDTVRAGDDLGFPMSFSIRHVKEIYREFENPEKRAYWNRVVEYEVRRFRNHPSIFMWAMNHNFTGWADDQNPAQLHGKFEPKPEDDRNLYERRHAASLAEQFVMQLDGTRPCYHHQSGPFNQMTTLNCYLCWTPLQERMEWISRWRDEGVKPLFFVEFGLPHHASWGGHREGPFIWTNSVNSEPLATEFGAIYSGDSAYALTEDEIKHYETIERVYASGRPFYIWEVLGAYWGGRWEHNFLEIKSLFTRYTWPAFRTYGISAILPWDQADLFKPLPNAQGRDVELQTDWDHLQRPGLAPDFIVWNTDWLTCPVPQGHIVPTSLGETFARVNRETLAYIAGPPERFTAQDHVFESGDKVTKQVVFLNDLRREVTFAYTCTAELYGSGGAGVKTVQVFQGEAKVSPGGKFVAPVRFTAPEVTSATGGRIRLVGSVDGRTDETLRDAFDFSVLPQRRPAKLPASTKIVCFDPKGLTRRALAAVGVPLAVVDKPTCPAETSVFIIGREAVSGDGPPIDLHAIMRTGATVLVFEQSEQVLQKLWGFRTASPGTRRVFIRQPSHPVCEGLTNQLLRDWRGSGTLLEAYPIRTGYHGDYPREDWCGFANSRTWQWGNYGTVASVVVEKPQRGNYSFILDCEFDQLYTPLFEWLTDGGRAIFCQLDLSGREGRDPVAERLLVNLIEYAAGSTKPSLGGARYVGDEATGKLLTDLGVNLDGGPVVIVGPGADHQQAKAAVSDARTVICLGLSGDALSAVLPFTVKTEKRLLTHWLIQQAHPDSVLVGLGNSDFHWRGRMEVEAITGGDANLLLSSLGDGRVVDEVRMEDGRRFVLLQILPNAFDYGSKPYLKLSYRHALIALARILTNCGVAIHSRLPEKLRDLPPGDVDLAGEWRFTTDPEARLTAETVSAPDFDATGWRKIRVPGMWERAFADLADYDGVAWYRTDFVLTAIPKEQVTLYLAAIDDEDWTYLNGKLIGHIGRDTNPDDYWSAKREYKIRPEDLREGRNVLVVRVNDLRQSGGFGAGKVGIFRPGAWLDSYYLDVPTSLDDPYRYNRW